MRAFVLLAMLAAAFAARADLYKCVGKDGKVSYQAEACEEGAGTKRLRTPVGPSGGGMSGSGLKDGWDEDKSGPIVTNCVRGAYQGGKRMYASAGGDPRKLHESELAQRLEAHCGCMMRRIMTTMTYAEFNANPTAPLQKVSAEAANGGDCKLDVSGLDH